MLEINWQADWRWTPVFTRYGKYRAKGWELKWFRFQICLLNAVAANSRIETYNAAIRAGLTVFTEKRSEMENA